MDGGRRAFAERFTKFSDDDLEDVARPYALWCHLMNTAEERQRLRTLRARGEHAPDGLAAAIDGLIDAGMTESELRAWLDHALVMPVITAHPTEARRRSSLDHLARLNALLDDVDRTGRARDEGAIAAEVLALFATEDARARRPTPLDEVEYSTSRPGSTGRSRSACASGSARRGGSRRSCAGARGSVAIATAIRTSPRRSRARPWPVIAPSCSRGTSRMSSSSAARCRSRSSERADRSTS
jgi:hypothetical protein